MQEFVIFIFMLFGFIGCLFVFPFWLSGGISIREMKKTKEEIKKLQKEILDAMEEYKLYTNNLENTIYGRVHRVEYLIEKMKVPLEEYIYKELIQSNLKNLIRDDIQKKFEDIEGVLKYKLEEDMRKIKREVEEVVAHFEKDDKRRLIEYVEKSFEKDGKQIILERLRGEEI